jgi:nitrogen-specific signal transduction histidine kinase
VLKTQFSHAQDSGLNIEQYFPARLPWVVADQEKLHQVLLNLCKNAVETMPAGGILSLREPLLEPQSTLAVL